MQTIKEHVLTAVLETDTIFVPHFSPKPFILINFAPAVDSVLLFRECGNVAYKTEFILV